MDVTSDTVAAGSLLSGKTATKNDGTKVTGNIASKTASDLTASGATVTAAAGYYPSAVSKAVATTTHPNPTASINSSTGVVTASHTQGTGYVTGGTTTGTLNLTTKAAATYYPSTSDQSISSGRWLTGNQTIKGVTTSNLTAANIKNGTVVKVGDSANASRITQVTGTLKESIPHTATIDSARSSDGNVNYCYVQHNGTKYYTPGQSFTFYEGDTIIIYAKGQTTQYSIGAGSVEFHTDNTAINTSYSAPGCDLSIYFSYHSNSIAAISIDLIDYPLQVAGDMAYICPTEEDAYYRLEYPYYGFYGFTVGGISSTYVGTGVPTQAAKTITPATYSQTAVEANRYTTGKITVNPIPSSYVQPSGTYTITGQGRYDVSSYSEAYVKSVYPKKYFARIVEKVEGYGSCTITNLADNSEIYKLNEMINFNEGDTLTFLAGGRFNAQVFLDGVLVANSGQDDHITYSWTATSNNVEVHIGSGSYSGRVYINTIPQFPIANVTVTTSVEGKFYGPIVTFDTTYHIGNSYSTGSWSSTGMSFQVLLPDGDATDYYRCVLQYVTNNNVSISTNEKASLLDSTNNKYQIGILDDGATITIS